MLSCLLRVYNQCLVRSIFHSCKIKENSGPDRITVRLLKVGADQLCDILCKPFHLSPIKQKCFQALEGI